MTGLHREHPYLTEGAIARGYPQKRVQRPPLTPDLQACKRAKWVLYMGYTTARLNRWRLAGRDRHPIVGRWAAWRFVAVSRRGLFRCHLDSPYPRTFPGCRPYLPHIDMAIRPSSPPSSIPSPEPPSNTGGADAITL